jgi:nitroreductase
MEMELQELEKLIKERRTIRKWKKEDVPDDLLRKAVEIATWAPNGGNYQGWRFVVVKNREVILKMADAVQAIADKIASWPESLNWKDELERYRANSSFFRNAPACIAVFAKQYISVMDRPLLAREAFDPEAKEIISFRRSSPTAVQSAAAAATTMLLAFHQMGLGAVWLGAPLMAKKGIESVLKIPKDLSMICLIAVGYPDESPRKDRNPVDQVLEFVG